MIDTSQSTALAVAMSTLEGKGIITTIFIIREMFWCYYIHRFIHLEFSQSSACEGGHSQFPDLHSLLLCAPTLTFCRQLAKIVSNSLRVVSRWTQQQVSRNL